MNMDLKILNSEWKFTINIVEIIFYNIKLRENNITQIEDKSENNFNKNNIKKIFKCFSRKKYKYDKMTFK